MSSYSSGSRVEFPLIQGSLALMMIGGKSSPIRRLARTTKNRLRVRLWPPNSLYISLGQSRFVVNMALTRDGEITTGGDRGGGAHTLRAGHLACPLTLTARAAEAHDSRAAACGRRLRRVSALDRERGPDTLRAAAPGTDGRNARYIPPGGEIVRVAQAVPVGRRPNPHTLSPPGVFGWPDLLPLSTSVAGERSVCRRPHPPRAAVRCPRRRSERPVSGRLEDVQKVCTRYAAADCAHSCSSTE